MAIWPYRIKEKIISRKVIGVAIKKMLPKAKYSFPKMMMLRRMEKGVIVHSMMDRSLFVYRGKFNIV